MIVDTSAIVAIFFEEPEATEFIQLIRNAVTCRMSVASQLELMIVLAQKEGLDSRGKIDPLLRLLAVQLEPVTLQQGLIARQAFYDFGKGRHPARLNFGDCFSYALAKARNEPLLFKGNDFGLTDVRIAHLGV